MTEATDTPAWDVMQYRCGRCGHTFTTTSEDEYRKLYGEHTGAACLAVLGPMDALHVRYLINDLRRLVERGQTVGQLLDVLEMLAAHKDGM